ncbi:MAG: PEP/pyruvate-binding domain-containing protein [Myxococcota bacterium]
MLARSPLAALLVALVAACGDGSPGRDASDAGDASDATDVSDTADATADSAPDDSGDATAPDADVGRPTECQLAADATAPDATPYLQALGCDGDFAALSAPPTDASLPGARALKTVYDRVSGPALYFQNTALFGIHHDFCAAFLSGHGKPPVPDLGEFNRTEYYSPSRRFFLGAVSFYAGPDAWTYEISPYDTASASMVATAFEAIRGATWFGADLVFHPTSEAQDALAAQLPTDIPVVTTDELLDAMDYRPLSLGVAAGTLRFVAAADLVAGTVSVDDHDIVVLDVVPAELPPTAAVISAELQAPRARVAVLAQARGTPDVSLRGAFDDPALRALAGKPVELTAGPFDWHIREISQDDAVAFWQSHRPTTVTVPALDLTRTSIVPVADLMPTGTDLAQAIHDAIPAYGGQAALYAALGRASIPHAPPPNEPLPLRPAVAVPVYFYARFLEQNGLAAAADAMLADAAFQSDPVVRHARLAAFREDLLDAPLDTALLDALGAAIDGLPSQRCRFRSSTNAEDLDDFSGAGLDAWAIGDPDDAGRPIDLAVKTVWASAWSAEAFAERQRRGIDPRAVGVALLVSPLATAPVAHGSAVSGNLFSADQSEPAFVVEAAPGAESPTPPPLAGTFADYFVYYWYYSGQPATYLSHSPTLAPGTTALTRAHAYRLGQALDAIHQLFAPVFQPPSGFYAMDVAFEFDQAVDQEVDVSIEAVRPHRGWGLAP